MEFKMPRYLKKVQVLFTETQYKDLEEIASKQKKKLGTLVREAVVEYHIKKKKEQEIVDKEKEAKNLQKLKFGKDGELFKKRQELVKPIQEKVYNAIQEVATANNYSVIFDKGGSLTMLYANPKYDVSDDVLDNLGATMSNRKGKSTQTTTPQKAGEFGTTRCCVKYD